MNTTESEDGSVGPLREALTVCAAAGMSGILRVTGDPGGAIHIADGLVAAIETPGAPGPEVLLLRSHRVSESGWDEAFAAAAASGRPDEHRAHQARDGRGRRARVAAQDGSRGRDVRPGQRHRRRVPGRAGAGGFRPAAAAGRRAGQPAGRDLAPDPGARRPARQERPRPDRGRDRGGQARGAGSAKARTRSWPWPTGGAPPGTSRSPWATASTPRCCRWPGCSRRPAGGGLVPGRRRGRGADPPPGRRTATCRWPPGCRAVSGTRRRRRGARGLPGRAPELLAPLGLLRPRAAREAGPGETA